MDSANSGSMQSSSGGDEEYDSSSHPHDSNYLLNPQTNTLNHLANTNQPTFLYSNDTYNNNNNILHPFSHSPSTSSLYTSNTNNNNIQDFWSTNPQNDQTIQTSYTPSQQQQQPSNLSINLDHPLSNSLPQLDHHQSSVSKNPKKRTRASRRAPTTVLTTDTSNFRQMVQEFTGIPAPPFSTATSAFSRRLDLFGAAARGESLIYPLRPSPQKVANIQPLYNTSMANITTTSNIVSTTSTPNSYQQSQQNVLNMQGNSMLNYQSMLQSQHQEANAGQESSRNVSVVDDDVEHFRSFSAPNVQLDQGDKGSY
ncbi:uncharacterized protein LOC141721674 [Apium graveolens]|uniref:uncharacterized protein LOC141721674 n=1 Tax=Apium graveolens TaxID=4045 RepID=UPI003D7A2DC4